MGLGGNKGLLLRAVKGTEWSQFLDYLSPSFLEVVPASHLIRQGREMLANAGSRDRFREIREELEELLRDCGIDVMLDTSGERSGDVASLPVAARRRLGQRALEVYFAQLLRLDSAILDLRAARFAMSDPSAAPCWFPRPFFVTWDRAFLEGVRALYEGFYREDDARFGEGLERLELEDAGDVLRAHFGTGNQREVVFRSAVFHSSFHDVFVRCRDNGVSLHRNFLALGLYLACLYDLLEALEIPFDVRDAFERAAA